MSILSKILALLFAAFCALPALADGIQNGVTTGSQLPGTTTNDNACTGCVGEYKSAILLQGSAVSFTTATPANVLTLSLTAGDWDVSGTIFFACSATCTQLLSSIGTTSATLTTIPADNTSSSYLQLTTNTGGGAAMPLAPTRISLSATTSVFLVGQPSFASGTSTGFGIIRARRVR